MVVSVQQTNYVPGTYAHKRLAVAQTAQQYIREWEQRRLKSGEPKAGLTRELSLELARVTDRAAVAAAARPSAGRTRTSPRCARRPSRCRAARRSAARE